MKMPRAPWWSGYALSVVLFGALLVLIWARNYTLTVSVYDEVVWRFPWRG